VVEFHQLAAAVYLAAGIGALLGVVVGSQRMERGAALGLGLGALLQGVGFATLHRAESAPPITDLPMAVSFVAWMAVLSLLALMWRLRVPALTAVVGPVAFLAVFVAAMRLTDPAGESVGSASGSWPHLHVLLGGAGVGLLCIAGVAGVFFLAEHGRLKAKRHLTSRTVLPSLEALDRVNVIALATGFPLLTLGLMTGVLWLQSSHGVLWQGTSHEVWMVIAWGIYAGLAGARFVGHQGARQAAASAVAGFCFLLFSVVGIGVLA
jgi:ABC-type transport system involved in cytochrome c biogenesis permease subunit